MSKYKRAIYRRRNSQLEAHQIRPGYVIEGRILDEARRTEEDKIVHITVMGIVQVVRYGPHDTLKFVLSTNPYRETRLYDPTDIIKVYSPDVSKWSLEHFGWRV